ncbi:MAG: RagB/SusD family nutrient uptake outer membrane protein [Chitinophagaceae bacterium]
MKKYKFLFLAIVFTGILFACKKQLDVKNPNQPTPASAKTESGIIALSQGGIYFNGLGAGSLKYGGFNGSFWNDPVSYHDLMGDVIGVEAANQYINQWTCPDWVVIDNGTKILDPNSPNKQILTLRAINRNANAGDNPFYYEWGYMYALIGSCNGILALVDDIEFTGDAATKKSTIKAWAYWWKGYAYSRIGSFYYAGIITDISGATNGNYVTKEKIIDEATVNFDKCAAALGGATNTGDYQTVLGKIIPGFFQVGLGKVPSIAEWKRNINTMKARNILVNTPSATMSAAQWTSIMTLASDGIKLADNVFTGRSNESADFISANSGTTAAISVGSEPGYRVSERLINDFKAGDKRFTNNFAKKSSPWVGNTDRGNVFNTSWDLIDGGAGMAGVAVMGTRTVGEYELYIAGHHVENQLMLAEAKIYSNDINGGLAIIDQVRTLQGAGLPAVSGTGLTLAQAKEELRKERRIAMAFRGLAFYDARRWGVINDVSTGGGRSGVTVLSPTGPNGTIVVNTNASINYNYLDYWDVPDNELVYNPPAAGSAPVKNPKQ